MQSNDRMESPATGRDVVWRRFGGVMRVCLEKVREECVEWRYRRSPVGHKSCRPAWEK